MIELSGDLNPVNFTKRDVMFGQTSSKALATATLNH
jgi:hypothetical protein